MSLLIAYEFYLLIACITCIFYAYLYLRNKVEYSCVDLAVLHTHRWCERCVVSVVIVCPNNRGHFGIVATAGSLLHYRCTSYAI